MQSSNVFAFLASRPLPQLVVRTSPTSSQSGVMRCVFLAVVLLAAGCGGATNHAKEYPPGAAITFVTQCAAEPNASADGCACIFSELEKRIPYARFETEGSVIARGDVVSGSDAKALRSAIGACAARIQNRYGG
jgi:hypothetical protein